MDKLLMELGNMNNEKQEEAFAELEKKFGSEIADMLKKRMFFIKLFTNETFNKAVCETMATEMYKEFNA